MDVAIKIFSEYHVDTWVTEAGKEQWRLTCFYGEANHSLRHNTWETMARLRSESTLPWICIGDFNEIRRSEEQFGPNERDAAQMAGLREAMDLCSLNDLDHIDLDWTFEKRVPGGAFLQSSARPGLGLAELVECVPVCICRALNSS